jgi:methanogenic corrinoid protein MtbC1
MNFNFNVSKISADHYKANADNMLGEVNTAMHKKNQTYRFIGTNPRTIMENNHRNHVTFMGALFDTNDYGMLEKTLPWVLHTYLSKGFSISYFSHVLKTWMEIIEKTLTKEACNEIIPVYEYMLHVIENDEVTARTEAPAENERASNLAGMLVRGDYTGASRYLRAFVNDKKSLMDAYINIVRPAMYLVGGMWESNEISVYHEHLSTSIIMRMMSSFYEQYVLGEPDKYKIVMAAAVNEFHEVGARMMSDCLEMNGYDMRYLGANVPQSDLLQLLENERPKVLGLSVSMSYNIGNMLETINEIRSNSSLEDLKIMAGGYAFSYADKSRLAELDVFVPDSLEGTLELCESFRK